MEETVERITGFVNSGYLHRVVTLNPEYLYRAQKQRELLDIVNASDLVTPDGIGIVWGCRIAGYPVVERVTGIDLMLNLCKRAASLGFRVFLLGAAS
ncbi:WecB/TagA/CpsF family glycosyltransferase [Peptococcaceae bacterium]|nr:WecB/TagA/CpsF family glycosyltransferase [Peptococcaceae bacterium]